LIYRLDVSAIFAIFVASLISFHSGIHPFAALHDRKTLYHDGDESAIVIVWNCVESHLQDGLAWAPSLPRRALACLSPTLAVLVNDQIFVDLTEEKTTPALGMQARSRVP
jgi:hypothetical protein